MEKRLGLEGSAESRMVQLMRKHGYNKDVGIEVGEVLSPLPDLQIRVPGVDFDLDMDDLIVAEHLIEHTRTIDFSGGSVSGAVDGYHGPGTLGSLSITGGTLTIKSPLEKGDQVIVISDNDSQFYFVIDKAVIA